MGKKTVQVFPKHVVEGMFAEFIASLKNSLDCCYYPEMLAETKLTPLQSIKATYGISKSDSEEVIEKLEPYTDASLCSKHRYMRDIIEELIGLTGVRISHRQSELPIEVFVGSLKKSQCSSSMPTGLCMRIHQKSNV